MIVLALVVLAAVLLAHGTLTERPVEVVIAGALSAVVVFAERRWRNRQAPADAEGAEPIAAPTLAVVREDSDSPGTGVDPDPGRTERPDSEVVFVAGRTTFHAPSCTAVEGRVITMGDRSQLERGGMTACRRCLS